MALFLSLVGIYGLTAFAAVQRTQEIGVRVAFGARPIDVVGLFLRSLRRPFVAGGAGGAVLALISLWVMRRTNLMLDLPAADPLAYAAAIVVLIAAALTATAIPAVRASRKDPWAALKDY